MAFSVRRSLLALALVVASLQLGGAQAQPVVAIVGARIVDGSGNDPFVGTVILEGGRIRAVGRSVEVPAGAVTVEAAGRTVLPGLIDVLVGLDGAGAEQTASAMAASLFSGVTSVGVVGVPIERLDGVRGDGGRPDTGPRVSTIGTLPGTEAASETAAAEWSRVFRSSPNAILVAVDAPGVEAVAADARSRGLRLIVDARSRGGSSAIALSPHLVVGNVGSAEAQALVAQNVTVAPDLLAVAPSAQVSSDKIAAELTALASPNAAGDGAPDDAAIWGVSAGSVKALRDARVRLAVASRIRSRLAPGVSTHAAVRLLVDAGLTPLQAVTAATSGGAWALGLQSDRGFLAPGMRADLVLVQGDPTTNIADLGRVERVFLGGAEVDRPALLTKVRAAEPTPSPTASTAPTPEVRKAADAASAAAVKSPPAGRASRRRRGAEPKVAAAAVTPPLPDTPPAASPSSAPSSPNPSSPNPSSPNPSSPNPSGTDPSSAPPAPAPSPERPVETPAPAAVAETAVKLNAPLIDDFERGDDRSAAGPGWASGSSEGTTPATIVMGRIVRGLRDHALHLTARMGEGKAPFARAAIPLTENGRPVDVSRYRGIRFDARGEGRYRIVFVTRSIVDGRYHESYFSGSPAWTPVGIPFASIGQNGRGSHASFTGRDLIEIRFEIARDPGRIGWLELDNLKFY